MQARALVLTTLLIVGPAPAIAQDRHIALIEQDIEPAVQVRGEAPIRRRLNEAMAAAHVPAISIAVIDHGHIAWAKAWGVADVASGAIATAQTPFQAGSVSKPVFASLVMQMVENGQLKLDQPVNGTLKRWRVPDSPFTVGSPVTLRHLLTHTGGLTVHGFPGYEAGVSTPNLVEVLSGLPPANTPPVVVDRKPGVAWNYSGGGITIAQLLVEEVSHERLPELAMDHVFTPLGMDDSTYMQPLSSSWIAAHSPATGYHNDGAAVPGRFHTYPEMAAAGLWTTPTDLGKWVLALQAAFAGRASPLMSQASARAMLTPGLGHWGLGIAVLGEGDALRFGHGGDDDGFKTELVGYLENGRGIVVMGNGDGATPLLASIEQAIARAYGWPGLDAKMIDAQPISAAKALDYVGNYGHGVAKIRVEGASLKAEAGPLRSTLIPIGADRFIALSDGAPVEFTRGGDGKISGLSAYGAALTRDP